MNRAIANKMGIGFLERHWKFLLLVLVLFLVGAARFRLAQMPLERDEGEYAYAGQLILEGIPPYKLAYNMKFPGTYTAYALIMAVFGQTPAGIHLGVICVTTLTALMLYWFCRRLLDETAGVVAATAYAILASSIKMSGLAGHATHFCALFATAGLCVLWPVKNKLSWRLAFVGGLLFGFAMLMKQHAAVVSLWGLIFLISAALRQREIPRVVKIRCVAAFCIGVLVPFGLSCLVLWRAGVFEQFWFWVIRYAREYISYVPISQAPQKIFSSVVDVTERSTLLWLLPVAGLALIWLDERLRSSRLWLSTFALASFLTICPGFFFRDHYFLLLLPAAALLAGCAICALRELWQRKIGKSRFDAWPLWAYLAVLVMSIFENRDVWFEAKPTQVARAIYRGSPFVESEVVADFIRTNSTPDTRVAVLGSEPQIYFLSHRHSATGYIYTYPLMEPQPFAVKMQHAMIREIESAKPEFVVFVFSQLSWLKQPGSDLTLFDWWVKSYQTNFTLAGAAVMDPPRESHYVWGPEAASIREFPGGGLLVYKRSSSSKN